MNPNPPNQTPLLGWQKMVSVGFVIIFFFTLIIKYYYTCYRPITAQSDRGFIFPANVYYLKTVYVTGFEKYVIDCIPWIQVILISVFFVMAVKYQETK